MRESLLNKITSNAISQLEALGIKPTYVDVLKLNALGNIATNGLIDDNLLDFCSKRVGYNFIAYPLTLGAKMWLQKTEEWFEDKDDKVMKNKEDIISWCFLYAYFHSRDCDKFEFDDAKKCRKQVIKWARKIRATEEEMVYAIDCVSTKSIEAILEDPENEIDEKKEKKETNENDRNEKNALHGQNLIPGIAYLMHYYGENKKYWLWEVSNDEFCLMLDHISKLEGSDKTSINDPTVKALWEFNKCINKIKENHSTKNK